MRTVKTRRSFDGGPHRLFNGLCHGCDRFQRRRAFIASFCMAWPISFQGSRSHSVHGDDGLVHEARLAERMGYAKAARSRSEFQECGGVSAFPVTIRTAHGRARGSLNARATLRIPHEQRRGCHAGRGAVFFLRRIFSLETNAHATTPIEMSHQGISPSFS